MGVIATLVFVFENTTESSKLADSSAMNNPGESTGINDGTNDSPTNSSGLLSPSKTTVCPFCPMA